MQVHAVVLIGALICLANGGNCQPDLGPPKECLDRNKIIRASGETWFVASTCENCLCKSGEITCDFVKRQCPSAPHPSCVKIPGGCCPTWDCSNHTCTSRKLGEIWYVDDADPCNPNICTEEGIRTTVKECPSLEPKPDSSCYLESDGKCCLRWQCIDCPDPKAFGQNCIQYKDQCQNDAECEYGEICCLVEGCGRECITPCIDSEGTSRAIGQSWMDPQKLHIKWICQEDGINIAVEKCPDETSLDEDIEEVLHQESQRLEPDEQRNLNLLSKNWPVKDVDFYKKSYESTLTKSGTSVRFGSVSIDDIQSYANQFNWSAIVPLLSRDITSETRMAFAAADNSLELRSNRDKLISESMDSLVPDSPSVKHQVAFRRTDPISTRMANLGHVIGKATQSIVESFKLPRAATSGLSLLGENMECVQRFRNFQRPNLASACDNESFYRTLDGSCNNPSGRLIGAAFTQFRRNLPPHYGDGVSTLRQSTLGTALPSARLVSSTINNQQNVDSRSFTIFHMTFGQFLDHDLTATPIGKGYLGGPVKCCDDSRTKFNFSSALTNARKRAITEAKLLFEDGKTMDNKVIDDLLNHLKTTGEALLDSPDDTPPVSPLMKTLQPDAKVSRSSLPRRLRSEECAPISIPADDSFYSYHGQTCMEFIRSVPAAMCTFGPREQLNQHSAYLDGSVIYGVKKETAESLRTFKYGLLKAQVTLEGQRLLPASLDRHDECNIHEKYIKGEYCFRSGDGRVNEQILLTLYQTVWKREHNRVAHILRNFNPTWNDEKLFQETRRIVVAELQHITYKEFLPTVLGPFVMNILKLNPLDGGEQTTDYDEGLKASISNVFATAAYRFGHSEVQDFILKINKQGMSKMEFLSSLFFHPFSLYEKDAVSNLARGGTAQPAAKVDTYFTEEVAGNLFKGSFPYGLDLVALNIQRGRDHGIPGYTRWRKHCGLPEVDSFGDLYSDMDGAAVNSMRKVYRSVYDIDLFVGGLAELPLLGGIIGPTFTCLIADQFLRIKQGDRFWYEYKDSPGAFTKEQLKQLHKVTFARILCNNIPELMSIQPQPLRNLNAKNMRMPCHSSAIPRYNFNPWRRRPISFPGDYVLTQTDTSGS